MCIPATRHRNLPLQAAVHLVVFVWFFSVWLWHLTEQAKQLPGAHGFGWFFRYLTFFYFTLQTIQFGLCLADDSLRLFFGNGNLTAVANDVACAVFGGANVVTIMFYSIQFSTKAVVEGGNIDRPLWLHLSVHLFNTAAAWSDLLVSSPRTFSKRSENIVTVLTLTYFYVIVSCRHMNGIFPYPFLNAMPQPKGFIITAVCTIFLFLLLFRIGKLVQSKMSEEKKYKYTEMRGVGFRRSVRSISRRT